MVHIRSVDVGHASREIKQTVNLKFLAAQRWGGIRVNHHRRPSSFVDRKTKKRVKKPAASFIADFANSTCPNQDSISYPRIYLLAAAFNRLATLNFRFFSAVKEEGDLATRNGGAAIKRAGDDLVDIISAFSARPCSAFRTCAIASQNGPTLFYCFGYPS